MLFFSSSGHQMGRISPDDRLHEMFNICSEMEYFSRLLARDTCSQLYKIILFHSELFLLDRRFYF